MTDSFYSQLQWTCDPAFRSSRIGSGGRRFLAGQAIQLPKLLARTLVRHAPLFLGPTAMHEKAFTVGAGSEDDLDAVTVLLVPFMEQKLLLERSRQQVADLLKTGFVALVEGQVIGFAAVEIYSSKLAEIQCLAVTPDWQHQGVGKELVRCCIAEAGRQNVLEVMAIPARDKFLVSCGFDYSLPGQKRALFIQALPG